MESLPPTLVLGNINYFSIKYYVVKSSRKILLKINHFHCSRHLIFYVNYCSEKNLSLELPQAPSLSVILPLVSAILTDDVFKS
ncbi:hypothetical protein HZH66_001027 [Vespula vulgaris]|uniref:Uncharacterized protein n=1 Tax=Vespula vulgaris TaxID=7454 RepID=A0A834KSA8_VESVU|nr:hypothetical protein HZH66_001027 [Vespula vulgaris]